MNLTETRISGECIFTGNVFAVELDKILLPDGTESEREVVRHPGGVAVLAIDRDDVILVRQYRYATGMELLEIPAGRLEIGEEPASAALRELAEETGYTTGSIQPLGKMIATGGYNSEIIHLFAAIGLMQGTPDPDPGEFVYPVRLKFNDLINMILSGEIQDGKTIAAALKFFVMSTKNI